MTQVLASILTIVIGIYIIGRGVYHNEYRNTQYKIIKGLDYYYSSKYKINDNNGCCEFISEDTNNTIILCGDYSIIDRSTGK